MEGEYHRETAMCAVVYAWWCRARANGLPDRELEEYMDAHIAFVDAVIDKDPARIGDASRLIKRWEHLAG